MLKVRFIPHVWDYLCFIAPPVSLMFATLLVLFSDNRF